MLACPVFAHVLANVHDCALQDMIIQFFLAYRSYTTGTIVVDKRRIAKKYFRCAIACRHGHRIQISSLVYAQHTNAHTNTRGSQSMMFHRALAQNVVVSGPRLCAPIRLHSRCFRLAHVHLAEDAANDPAAAFAEAPAYSSRVSNFESLAGTSRLHVRAD